VSEDKIVIATYSWNRLVDGHGGELFPDIDEYGTEMTNEQAAVASAAAGRLGIGLREIRPEVVPEQAPEQTDEPVQGEPAGQVGQTEQKE
jgi:hypothetical protein